MSVAPESPTAETEPVVLVLAPLAGDAAAMTAILSASRMKSRVCQDANVLRAALLPDSSGVLFVVATQEAGTQAVADILLEADRTQPEWSRVPILYLVQNVRSPPPACASLLHAAGQPPVVLLERPVKQATLASVFDMQRRTRDRQYENRDLQEQLREAARYKDFLLRELRHRTGNSLAVLQSLFRLTARRHSDIDGLVEDFERRFGALVSAYDRLVPGHEEQLALHTVCRQHLDPYAQSAEQVVLDGPDVAISERLSFDLALVIHELATNAAKYGALSVAEGKVEIQWSIAPDTGTIDIVWQERGGPAVTEPTREGLGSLLIRQFGGVGGAEMSTQYLPEGVRWTARIPRENYQPSSAGNI